MALIARLNPPQLNGRLPAFYGNELIIPFDLNRSVGFNQFDSMVAIVKTVSTNSQKAFLSTGIDKSGKEWGRIWYDSAIRSYRVSFITQTEDSEGINYFTPQVGQYYKVQLAFVASGPFFDNPEAAIGYYSSVGVIKYSAKPELYIKGLDKDIPNKNTYEYVGVYLQEHDQREKVYSYEFDLYDEFNNIIATTGMKIHNNSTDIDLDSSFDTWRITKNLTINKPYYIQYKAITMNGLGEMVPCESPKYKIMELDIALPDISAQLSAQLNEVEGYIQLSLIGDRKPNDTLLRSGAFVLLRSSSKNNYDTWEQLTEFALSLYSPHTDKEIYKDYVVEQGVDYIYAIQAYNKQGYMSGRLTNQEGPIHCDFEDAFLYDGERQLKIRFNPSITNFKPTILENKVDTIGSKYPFIFRNGIVNYKEFSISGLLSLLGDENEQFLNDLIKVDSHLRVGSPGEVKDITPVDSLHLLTGDNYYKERQFKLKAAEWLSNGQPKLFKSPAEGNYIVRLMGISLSPEETLGRMLHTFNCNACEIAEYNFENLDKYNLIPGYSEISDLKYYTIDLNNIEIQFKPSGQVSGDEEKTIQLPQTYEATITGTPGTAFTYQLANDKTIYSAIIGSNGVFEFPKEKLESFPLIFIELGSANSWGRNATLLIGYRDPRIKTFSYIYDVTAIENKIDLPFDFDDSEYDEMTDREIILPPFYDGIVKPTPPEEENPDDGEEGAPGDGEGEEEVPEEPKRYWMKDLLKFLEDLRKKTGLFNFIQVSARNIFELIYNAAGGISGFKDMNGKIHNFTGSNFDIFDLDALYKTNDGQYCDGFDLVKNHDWNFKPFEQITNEFVLDDQIFNIKNYIGNIKTFTDIPSLWNFKIGNGLKLEVIYQEKDIYYSIEEDALEISKVIEDKFPVIKELREIWEKSIKDNLSKDIITENFNNYFEASQSAELEEDRVPLVYIYRLDWSLTADKNIFSKEEIAQKYNKYLSVLETELEKIKSELKVGVDGVIYAM